MSKTARDIEAEGGKCEKVATDFWECVDKNGTVWWCSDRGQACVEKPSVSIPSRCEDQTVKDIHRVRYDLQMIGHRDSLARIQKASRVALAEFPTDSEISELPPRGRRVLNRIRDLLQAGCECTDWDTSQLVGFLSDVSWGVGVADAVTAFLMRDDDNGGGGGGGEGCSTKCRKVYDRCVNDEGCDTDCWICLCESTCSLEYMSCMAKCLKVGAQGAGIFAA